MVYLTVPPGDAPARDARTDEAGLATFESLASDHTYVLRVLFPGFAPVVLTAVASWTSSPPIG